MRNIMLVLGMAILLSGCRKHNETEPPSNAAAFLTYSIAGQVSSIINQNSHNITVILPMNSSVSNLVASFTSSPLSSVKIGTVAQVSGVTPNDFTHSVVYTIEAEDGSTINWYVTVTVVPSNSAIIFSYAIHNQLSSVVDTTAHTISVVIPLSERTDSLVAEFAISPNSTIVVGSAPQISGVTTNDFSQDVIYTVTAQDGTTIINWLVHVDYENYVYESGDFPTGNISYYYDVDSTEVSMYTTGLSGKGKRWSFLNVVRDVVDTIRFTNASEHPSYSHFPGSNFVFYDNNQPFDMFGKRESDKAEIIGVHIVNGGISFDLPLTDNMTQAIFPSSVGTTFTDHGSVSKDTLTTISGIPFPVKVTIKVDFDVTSTIDANGIIKTDNGTFKCIRESKELITTVQVLALGNPIPGYGGTDTVRTYNFINKEAHYPVAIVEVDAAGLIKKVKIQQQNKKRRH